MTGLAKFRQFVAKGEYGRALDVIREQIASGANIIDINMDEALIDSTSEIKELLT